MAEEYIGAFRRDRRRILKDPYDIVPPRYFQNHIEWRAYLLSLSIRLGWEVYYK